MIGWLISALQKQFICISLSQVGSSRSMSLKGPPSFRWMDCRWKTLERCYSNTSTSLEIGVDDFHFKDEQPLNFIFQWRTWVILLPCPFQATSFETSNKNTRVQKTKIKGDKSFGTEKHVLNNMTHFIQNSQLFKKQIKINLSHLSKLNMTQKL